MGNKCSRICGSGSEENTIHAVKEITKITGNNETEKKKIIKIQTYYLRYREINKILKIVDQKRNELKDLYKNRIVTFTDLLNHEHPNVLQVEQLLPPLKQDNSNVFKYCFTIDENPIITSEKDQPINIYRGSFNLQGQYHGNGILVKSDGSKYEGYWVSGLLSRVGRFILNNGDYYEGNFKMGEPHGMGIFVQSDGTRYEGNWENSYQHGFGEEYFPDGASYKGDYMYGKKTGIGRFDWEDGSYYEGELNDGKMHGKGLYHYSDGRVYNGEWSENKMNGKGIMTYPDGKRYEGDFINDERNGKGKFIWNKKKWYEGEWKNGKQNGEGILYFDGRKVKGTWKNGQVGKIIHPKNLDLR